MAQFGVYRNPNPATAKNVPYLLDIQCELLASISTRVVVPLVKTEIRGTPAERLNPIFTIEDQSVTMLTEQMAGVPCSAIGEPVTSLAEQRPDILAAVDFLLAGS